MHGSSTWKWVSMGKFMELWFYWKEGGFGVLLICGLFPN